MSHTIVAVDEAIAEAMADGVPGLSLAVIRQDSVLISKGYGISNLELGTPATERTVYKLGSLSKHFMAAAILMLARDGRVELDRPLDAYLGPIPHDWRQITLRHLLTHTAGLPRDPARFDPYVDRPIAEYVNDAFAAPLLSTAGAAWAYSNLGYFVIAEVIRQAAGMPFDAFVRERVFEPAQMNQTLAARSSDIVPGRASSYLHVNGKVRNAGELRALRPSGAFVSSVADMAKWLKMLLIPSNQFGSSLLDELARPAQLSDGGEVEYGFGLFIGHAEGRKLLWHGGGLWCFRCEMLIFPELALAIVVMANAQEADAAALALKIASRIEPELRTISPGMLATNFSSAADG